MGCADTPGRPDLVRVAQRAETIRREAVPRDLARLKSQFTVLAPPSPAEWLANHREEGQTLAEFRASAPPWNRARPGTIGLVLIGSFTSGQREALEQTRSYLQAVFGLTTRILTEIPDRLVPARGRRKNPMSGQLQYLTRWIYEHILKPHRTTEFAAMLGFTSTDLYPDPGWNFVFGIAYPQDRIGLWSVARFGDPDRGATDRRIFLERTLGTAIHEAAHLFGMSHCIAWECLMNGSDSLEESDRHPLLFCPSCQAKVAHLTGMPNRTALQRQRMACEQAGLAGPARRLQRLADLLAAE